MPEQFQTIVFLVRHGQTDHLYSQQMAVDNQRQLTALGRDQSKKVGQYLAQFQPSALYSSPLERCLETAQLIKSGMNFDGPVVTASQLAEIYSPEPRLEAGERGESIFKTILTAHTGEQVVAVTHQYIIGYVVAEFLGVKYQQVLCDFADIYRLVFAGDKLVEATRLQPAK